QVVQRESANGSMMVIENKKRCCYANKMFPLLQPGSRCEFRMNFATSTRQLEGARILVTAGPYQGRERVCLRESDDDKWAVSLDGDDEVLHLRLEQHFSLLIDLSGDP